MAHGINDDKNGKTVQRTFFDFDRILLKFDMVAGIHTTQNYSKLDFWFILKRSPESSNKR